jgi:hypothetical protein
VDALRALLAPPGGAAADVNVAGGSGATALHVAVQCDQLEAVRVLLQHGASLHARMKARTRVRACVCTSARSARDCT